MKPPDTSNNSLAPAMNCIDSKMQVKLDGNCLKQDRLTFTYKKVVNIYIVYDINFWPNILQKVQIFH